MSGELVWENDGRGWRERSSFDPLGLLNHLPGTERPNTIVMRPEAYAAHRAAQAEQERQREALAREPRRVRRLVARGWTLDEARRAR